MSDRITSLFAENTITKFPPFGRVAVPCSTPTPPICHLKVLATQSIWWVCDGTAVPSVTTFAIMVAAPSYSRFVATSVSEVVVTCPKR